MTLCLNENYEGGYFQINVGKESEPLFIQAKKGRAIFFPSFMIHRVTPVTLGTRRSLVVWVLGPKFK
jgi:PKHD-type hydroxylase